MIGAFTRLKRITDTARRDLTFGALTLALFAAVTLGFPGFGLGVDRGLDAALCGQRRRVDERDGVLDHRGEQAAQRREPQHLDLLGGQLSAHLHAQVGRQLGRQGAGEQPEFAHQVEPRRDLLADHTAADVDRVGHELPGEREAHAGGHVGARPVLRLGRRGTEVRGHHDLGKFEQRAVGARLGGEDVEAGGADVAGVDRVGEGLLVDQPAAGGVDDDHAGLGLGQRVLADQSGGLLGLRQVHRDEVRPGEQLVQG
jgi:hypothetical protein